MSQILRAGAYCGLLALLAVSQSWAADGGFAVVSVDDGQTCLVANRRDAQDERGSSPTASRAAKSSTSQSSSSQSTASQNDAAKRVVPEGRLVDELAGSLPPPFEAPSLAGGQDFGYGAACGDGCEGGETCCNCGCCCPADQWYADAGVYYIQPVWKTNPAFNTAVTIASVGTSFQTDFDYDLQIAPLVRAGFRPAEGLGLQGRAWWYEDDQTLGVINDGATAINTAGPLGLRNVSTTAGDVDLFSSSLDVHVVDALFTYPLQFQCGSLEFGAGARYARIEQKYSSIEIPAAGGLFDVVESGHDFDGVGPSLSIEGRLAASQRLTLFGVFRYSLLFGRSEQSALLINNNVLNSVRFQQNGDLLPIAEFELGGEYTRRFGRAESYVQAAFVSQLWQGAGNSANNDIITVQVDPEVSDKNADLGFWGFRAEAGVRF